MMRTCSASIINDGHDEKRSVGMRSWSRHRSAVLLTCSVGIVSCGGGDGPAAPGAPSANRSPEAVGSIPPGAMIAGEMTTVDVAPAFRDPDGDALTYAATSSASDIVLVSILGSRLRATARAVGTASVTVTASDPAGLSATQSQMITVSPPPNRPPHASGSIPAQTVRVGESVTVDVAPRFRDVDRDTLTYSAASSDPAVVTATIRQSELTMTGVAAGTATVTVTATDPDGEAATQTVSVTVPPPAPDLAFIGVRPESVFIRRGSGIGANMFFTLLNVGERPASATTARILVSTDSTITTSDNEIGTLDVPRLDVGERIEIRVTLTASYATPVGLFYAGMCVARVEGESNTDNNCSGSVWVSVVSADLAASATPEGRNEGLTADLTLIVRRSGEGEPK